MSGNIKQIRRAPFDEWQRYPNIVEVMVLSDQIHAFPLYHISQGETYLTVSKMADVYKENHFELGINETWV